MLRAKLNHPHDAASAHEAFAETLRRNSVIDIESSRGADDDVAGLGMSTFQLVSQSLVGPFGLHAPTLFAALGSLAGYAAKWAVALDVADRRIADDFRRQAGDGGRPVIFSDHVRAIVSGLGRPSVLSIVIGAATRANVQSFGAIEALTHRTFLPGPPNAMPDYDVEARHYPQFAPEALLMMLWENVNRTFRAERRPRSDLALGLAFGAAHAIGVWRNHVSPEISATLVMESALAMAKIDRAF